MLSLGDSVWDRFPKRELLIDKALQQNLDWVVLAVFFSSNYFCFNQSKFICHEALKKSLRWSSIAVYLLWCAEDVFTLIVDRILFAVVWCFYFDHQLKFICCQWYTENILTLIMIKVYLQWLRCKKYFYFVFDH